MSYLLDKKNKQRKNLKIALGVVVLLILVYFRSGIWNVFSKVSETVFHPVLTVGNSFGEKLKGVGAYFASKKSLYLQNQDLQSKVAFDDARMSNYDSLVLDEAGLKEILNRKDPKVPMVLAAILAKPNQSVYDTLLIDAGINQGIKVGNTVFALGNVPIGRVDIVFTNSSKVVLFSSPGETTEAVVSGNNTFMQLVGRGGGNFEISLPKDSILQIGDQVVMPGINSYVLSIVQKVISDPRDPFTKALLTSPVNIQNLKFVEVEQ